MPRLIARFGEERMLAFSFFIGATSLILVPFFTHAVMLALLSFLFGLGMGCGQPITIMLTFNTSVSGHSGEALGLRITANHMARMAGPLLFGAIGSVFGLFPLFWLNALMLLAGGGLTVTGRTVKKAKL
jgi:predicted MFS family arabinose efflux permease